MKDSAPFRRSIMLGSTVVFAITIILRVPSCYESFWLDELHSAWCVWGSFYELFPRAEIGNQSPFYFVGLWCWRQFFGDSEVGLRLSSVLAVAASSVILTVSIAQWTRSLAAGMAAGLVIGLESNAIFFGTELRPYAFVILFASIALTFFLRLSATETRHQHSRDWSAMIIAILLAAMCQPTSIGVLACLPLSLCFVWLLRDSRQMLKVTLPDILLGLLIAAVGLVLWRITLGETWHQRSNWEAFAAATRVAQIWEVWDWSWLLFIPLSMMLVSAAVAKFRKTISSHREVITTTLLLALIAVLATSLYWGVSRANLAPLWHRRYFIAVLPIFAGVAGGSVGAVEFAIRPLRTSSAVAFFTATVLAIGLAYRQGTLQQLPNYPVALAIRGEDWRAANAWVRSNAQPADTIYLDAGLVEAQTWLARNSGLVGHGDNIIMTSPPAERPTSEQLDYLVFAAKGPYDIGANVLPTTLREGLKTSYDLSSEWSDLAEKNKLVNRVIVITRRRANQLNPSLRPTGSRVVGFGNISVIVRPASSGHKP